MCQTLLQQDLLGALRFKDKFSELNCCPTSAAQVMDYLIIEGLDPNCVVFFPQCVLTAAFPVLLSTWLICVVSFNFPGMMPVAHYLTWNPMKHPKAATIEPKGSRPKKNTSKSCVTRNATLLSTKMKQRKLSSKKRKSKGSTRIWMRWHLRKNRTTRCLSVTAVQPRFVSLVFAKRSQNQFYNYEQNCGPNTISNEAPLQSTLGQLGDAVYVPPPILDVPPDIVVPPTQKLARIVEKTANFIASQGTQMEIIVKAKQANNPMFQFLHFDTALHPFYRHVLTAIR